MATDRMDTLRLRIRNKLAAGMLPHDHIPRFWGGPADGEECDACEDAIGGGELLMEAISTLNNQGIQFHVECFYIWDSEREVVGRDRTDGGRPD